MDFYVKFSWKLILFVDFNLFYVISIFNKLSKLAFMYCMYVGRHGRSPQRRVHTQTTQCYLRLWSAGPSTCLRNFCHDTCRSSTRSTGDIWMWGHTHTLTQDHQDVVKWTSLSDWVSVVENCCAVSRRQWSFVQDVSDRGGRSKEDQHGPPLCGRLTRC